MTTLLLSDLHLPTGPSPLREGFLRFLSGPARGASAVYILGDLFEYWIGDDVGLRDYQPEIAALTALTQSGVPVYFQHGNRDFMVGKGFARVTGVKLLRDPLVVELEGRKALLSHGDLYCTADVGYQRWRRFSHNPVAQWIFLRLPRARRERIAGGIRGNSDQQKRYKPEDIMDVTPAVVEASLRKHGVTQLLHGHTHRPAEHALTVDGQSCQRLVLADWRPERMEYLRVDASGIQRALL